MNHGKKLYLHLKYISVYLKKHVSHVKRIGNIVLIVLLIFFVWHFRQSLLDALRLSTNIGFNFLWLPLLFAIWNMFATAGWQSILKNCSENNTTTFLQLYSIRIQSQALNLMLPISGVGGEALRSVKIKKENGFQNSIFSVVMDKSIDVLAEIALALAGIIIAIQYFPCQKWLFLLSVFLLLILISIFIFWNLLLKCIAGMWKSKSTKALLRQIGNKGNSGYASVRAFLYHLIEHVLMAIEILVVAHLTGIRIGLEELFYVNTISSLFNILFIIVPGRVGSYECSLSYAFSQLSLSPAAGISIALIRRARQLIVCAVGTLLMTIKSREIVDNGSASVPVN